LACRRSAPRQQRHRHLNDIIWRAMKRAQIPAVKEPVGLMRQDGKRPDGTTVLPWSRGKPLAWDVTIPDTHARRCTRGEHSQRGRSCSRPCISQQEHQVQPAIQHPHFLPSGHRNSGHLALPGAARPTSPVTRGRPLYLFQQLSIALQRGNAVSFQSTFTTS